MVNRIPEELFRRRPDQQKTDETAPETSPQPEPTGEPTGRKPEPARHRPQPVLIPIRIAAVLVFVAVVVGYVAAQYLLDQPAAVVSAEPSTSEEPSASASSTPEDPGITFYDGPTVRVSPLDAGSTCAEGDPRLLLDGFPTTAWHCDGDGVGQKLTFTFEQGQPIVGLSINGGNTAEPGRFDVERRILSVRWRFSDGSWFEQGLSSHDSSPQDIEFPPIIADYVELEILSTTEPGEPDEWNSDAVSISEVGFLAPE